MPAFDLTFAHAYTIGILDELPGAGQPIIYLPGGSTTGGKDGLLLRIAPEGKTEWLGCFAFGFSSSSLSGIFATPNPSYVCVVSRGQGYLMNAGNPEKCSQIDLIPVRDVRIAAEEKLLLLADFSSVLAVGVTGLQWVSPRLCLDDLRISEIAAGILKGYGFDGESDDRPFALELRTGKVLQSAYPFT